MKLQAIQFACDSHGYLVGIHLTIRHGLDMPWVMSRSLAQYLEEARQPQIQIDPNVVIRYVLLKIVGT